MSEAYMDCDRNICYQNGLNGIECEDCEVTKAYEKERCKIHVDVEHIVHACDDSHVTYECFIPELLSCEDNPRFNFYIGGKEMKSWPEYIFSLKVGNCIIYRDPPSGFTGDCIPVHYLLPLIADEGIKYYYRIKEIKDDMSSVSE